MYIVILSTSQLSCSQSLKLLPDKSSTYNLCFILLPFTVYYASCSPCNNEKCPGIFKILKDIKQIFLFFLAELCCLWRKVFISLMCQCYHQLKPWTPTVTFTRLFHCYPATIALYRYHLVLGIFLQLLLSNLKNNVHYCCMQKWAQLILSLDSVGVTKSSMQNGDGNMIVSVCAEHQSLIVM